MSKKPKAPVEQPKPAQVVPPPPPEFWARQLEQPSGEDLYHTWRQYGPGSVGDTFSRR